MNKQRNLQPKQQTDHSGIKRCFSAEKCDRQLKLPFASTSFTLKK